jgi:hypothetical protein
LDNLFYRATGVSNGLGCIRHSVRRPKATDFDSLGDSVRRPKATDSGSPGDGLRGRGSGACGSAEASLRSAHDGVASAPGQPPRKLRSSGKSSTGCVRVSCTYGLVDDLLHRVGNLLTGHLSDRAERRVNCGVEPV